MRGGRLGGQNGIPEKSESGRPELGRRIRCLLIAGGCEYDLKSLFAPKAFGYPFSKRNKFKPISLPWLVK